MQKNSRKIHGTPIGLPVNASFLAAVIGLPLVAFLGDLGGWPLPFAAVGGLILAVLGLQWYWYPRRPRQTRPAFSFASRFKEVGRRRGIWQVLTANALYQMAAFGLFTYLAAFLIQTYEMTVGDTALPFALVGTGAMLGSLIGGRIAGHAWRLTLVTAVLRAGGLLVGATFMVRASPWITILLAYVVALLLTIFEPVTWALIAELAGESRATANGLLATSNQLGAACGASIGGLVFALGGFPLVGLFCLGAAVAAAVVIRPKGQKVRQVLEQIEGA